MLRMKQPILLIVEGAADDSMAVEEPAEEPAAEKPAADEASTELEEAAPAEAGFHQTLKTKFIEGGAGFMGIVLLVLILGLALALRE